MSQGFYPRSLHEEQMSLILPRVNAKAVEMMDRFIQALGDGEWHKASDLATRLRTSDRVVRLCAEKSEGRVIGTNKGYKLQRYATSDEYFEWENRMRSQAREMLRRIVQARKQRNYGRAA